MAIKVKNNTVIDDNGNVINVGVVGIGTTGGGSALNVVGDTNISGIVTASSFVGDLTGTATTAITAGTATTATVAQGFTGTPNITVGVVTASSFVGDLTGTATTAITAGTATTATFATTAGTATTATVAQGFTGTPNITVGVVTASSFIGNLTGTATTATNVIGGIGSISSLTVSGISTLGTVRFSSGIVTASSGIVTYYGDGSKLTGVGSSTFWSQSASGITTTSNVGIGTTNPTVKLDVVGDARFTGIVTALRFVGDGSTLTGVIAAGTGVNVQNSGSALGVATVINFVTDLTASFSSGIVTVSSPIYWVRNSAGIHTLGNVGIGTTNPGARLSVASTSSGNSVLSVNDNLSDGSLFRVNNSSGGVLFDVDADGTVVFLGNGNVGIGTTTTTPTSKLQVDGSTSLTGSVNISGPTRIVNNALLTVNENLSDGSLFRVNNNSGAVLFDVDADGTVLFLTSGNVGIGTTITSPTSKLQVDGTTYINGNLGVGTASPTTRLDVVGDVSIAGTTKVRGFVETQGLSTITSNVLSLNGANGTVFTHTTSSQIGIVSFSGISTSSASCQTFTVLVTQGATPVNVTSATGIGTQLATVVTTSGVGISTNIKVGSGSTIVLTNTAGALDVLTFIVSYNGSGISSSNFTIIGLASTNFR